MIEWLVVAGFVHAVTPVRPPETSVPQEAAVIEVPSTRIWSEAPHSAFVDLIRFRARFYCAFREGSGHVPGEKGSDGAVRVIVSSDGEEWASAAHIVEEGVDLRDPKLSVTPDGRIMVVMGGSVYDGKKLLSRLPRASFVPTRARSASSPTGGWRWSCAARARITTE